MHSKTERIAKEAQFWVLMAQGSTLIAACNAVGVDGRTGRRWRQATGGRIPRKKPEPSGRYLSLEERLLIAGLHLAGGSARSIAMQLDRSASTISRELRRNGSARVGGAVERMHHMRPRSKPSCAGAGPRAVSSTRWNWPTWCRPSYA
ncbi:helix-turn-helix domain-containing protein [Arthrobacter sp. ERGS1:01]|uniref:helix-turn-helix domain-containing protein n=1 Tax=Arthrobacter sp. ERGS1:01 TaxID=1704044 RepID=UPI0009EB9BCF